jgi:hypothetical protein
MSQSSQSVYTRRRRAIIEARLEGKYWKARLLHLLNIRTTLFNPVGKDIALRCACEQGRLLKVLLLLLIGASPNGHRLIGPVGGGLYLPLHVAVRRGDLRLIKILLR